MFGLSDKITGKVGDWFGNNGVGQVAEQGSKLDLDGVVNLAVTTSNAETAVLDANKDISVILHSDVDVYIAQGSAPTATTTDFLLSADVYFPVILAAGDKISGEAVAVAGTLKITKQI